MWAASFTYPDSFLNERERKQKEKEQVEAKDAVKKIARDMLEKSVKITKATLI